jgi:HlyD family secretion protein
MAGTARRTLLLLTLAGLSVAGVAYYAGAAPGSGQAAGLTYSGTIEARQVAVVAEVPGQISALLVREGDLVTSGMKLVQLDPALFDAQILRAQAGLDVAKANLAAVRASARDEQAQQGRALVAQALAGRDGARQALADVQAIRDNPQQLDAQITQARAQLAAAEAGVPMAETQLRTARIMADHYQGAASLQDRAQLGAAQAQVRAAEAGLKAAQATRDGVQATVDLMVAIRATPLQLDAQVHAAQSRRDQAEAALALAQANLDALLAGPTREQAAIADAQVQLAQAALDQLQVQRDKATLRAPTAGVVAALPVSLGENVQAGSKLLSIADLDAVYLTLYVPESQIGRVAAGLAVDVSVDSLPGRVLPGQVYFVSPKAEFTPTTAQTKEERAKTVFMVKVRVANANHALKPGMPADATLRSLK